MNEIRDINESFAYIISSDTNVSEEIMNLLTFVVANHKFNPFYRSGQWDGKQRFYRIYNSHLIIPKGIVSLLLSKLSHRNFNYVPLDYSSHKISNIQLPTFEDFQNYVKSLNIPFSPYDYQIQAAFDSIHKRRQTNVLATSAGKSVIIYIISRWMLEHNLKTVIIVPSIILTEQLKNDFNDYIQYNKLKEEYKRVCEFWDESIVSEEREELEEKISQIEGFLNNIHLIGGDNKIKHFDSPITITTWQSVYNSPDLFADVDTLIVDECHGVKASSFSDIIIPSAINTVYRLGFTGTLPPDVIHKLEVISSMGPPKVYITAQDLIERGLATPVEIVAVFLNYSKPDSIQINSHNKNYRKQIDFIATLQNRKDILSKLIKKLQTKGNVLVLFNKINLANELIKTMYPEQFEFFGEKALEDFKSINETSNKEKTFLINGSTKSKHRNEILALLEETTNNILFGTEKILSTGVSVKNLHYIVNISSSGKSQVTLIQSVGRLLRKHVSKNLVKVYDVVDNSTIEEHNKSYPVKHWEERLEIYRSSGYPMDFIEIFMPDN